MQVTVNGEYKDVAPDATVADLLASLGLDTKTVVVQRNEDILEKHTYGSTILQDGDVLDLVRFVGGG